MHVFIQVDQTVLVFIGRNEEGTNILLLDLVVILFSDFWSVYETVLVLVKCNKIDFMLFLTGQRGGHSSHEKSKSVHYLIIPSL